MRKILLINPDYSFCNLQLVPPLGLEYLAEELQTNDYRVDIIDLTLERKRKLMQKIQRNNYFATGITVRNIDTTNKFSGYYFLPRIKDLVFKIKKIVNVPIILGGAGFSISPKEILKYTGADYGVFGAGIPALQILLKKIEKNRIKSGTILSHNSKTYLNFSFKRDFINNKKYQTKEARMGVSTKIGCVFNCIYCTYPKIEGNNLKMRPPKKVIEEVKNLVNRGINQIFFTDSVFNIPRNHAEEICARIIKKKLSINWLACLSPIKRCFSKKLLKLMKESGLDFAYFTVDSFSNKILKVYKKGFTINDIERALKLCRKEGIKTAVDILFGAPNESRKTVNETLGFIDKFQPDNVRVHIGIRIYPATEITKIAENQGIIKKSDDLLQPFFYPLPLALEEYIIQEIKKRPNCQILC